MTARAPLRLAVLAAVVVAAPARAGTFHAAPAVQVVDVGLGAAGAGAIVLRNDGAAPVVASAITAEPGCDPIVSAAPLTGFTLAPGATRTIAIACAAAPAGLRRCGYRVRSLIGAELAAFEAACAAAGAATLVPDATAIDLGPVELGRAAAATITLQHAGAGTLRRLAIATTDLDDDFAIAAPCNPDARACDAAIAAVPAGGSTTLVARCTPRALGPLAAELHVVSSAGTRLPAPIALTCTGVAATGPVIAASPTAIDVGTVDVVDATARATVHLRNPGTGVLRLVQVQLVDGGAAAVADWTVAVQPPCTAAVPPSCTLGPDEAVDLELAFDPSALGARDATLLITYHDTADRALSIPLRGVGGGATLELASGPLTLDLGAVAPGSTAAFTLQVANRGTRDLASATRTLTPTTGFATSPSAAFAVPAAGLTPLIVSCTPPAPGPLSATLRVEATDAIGAGFDVALRCTGDPAVALTAAPPALALGEIRLGSVVSRRVTVASVTTPVVASAAALETPNPALALTGTPAATPAQLTITASPITEGALANRVLVTPSVGPALPIAVTGAAVIASYSVPARVSLGTFCVAQPTTARMVPLTATGTATLGLDAPTLAAADSPFDLQLVAPIRYPGPLPAAGRALVAITPKRRATAGTVTDELVWATDVAGAETSRTQLDATFVTNGGAIAPPALAFGAALVHLENRNAQQVTLQNCDVAPLTLDAPQLGAPFSIDSPNFPTALRPGETATFSVGFHPTRLGAVTRTLTITSPQLRGVSLTVALAGEGVANAPPVDAGPGPAPASDSFYACLGCGATGPAGALAPALAIGWALRRRRR